MRAGQINLRDYLCKCNINCPASGIVFDRDLMYMWNKIVVAL